MADETGIQTELRYIRRDLDDIKAKLNSGYVSRDEFEPIKKIVYGLVSLILVGVVGALTSLIIVK